MSENYADLVNAAENPAPAGPWDGPIGSVVQIDPTYVPEAAGKVYEVVKKNRTTVEVRSETGKHIRVDRTLLAPATRAFAEVLEVSSLTLGSVVTFKVNFRDVTTDMRFVVLAVNRDDTYRLARLGGDAGRYFKSVRGSVITHVTDL